MTEAATIPPISEKIGPQPSQFSWYPDLRGKTCVVVASGPSAKDTPLDILMNKPDIYVITINESWKLAPWANMLYGCDAQWWYKRRGQWVGFNKNGLKITQDRTTGELLINEDIKRVFAVRGSEHLLLGQPGYIGWGGNSGFQALNLAMHFEPAKIILVGYDMSLKNGEHWHGRHANGLHNPKPGHVERWRRVCDRAYFTLQRHGVIGVSTAINGALNNWPKMTLEDALQCNSLPQPSPAS